MATGPQRRLLEIVQSVATRRGRDVWLVGGAVRDVALSRTPTDLDIALDGSAPLFARRAARELAATVEVKAEPRFGTASVTLAGPGGPSRLDVAQLRRERYPRPGALPVVQLGATLEADLARRDVTVNAVALALVGRDRGRVVDPFDGLGDLRRGRLCVLHSRSFRDDATRLWRNARTAASASLTPDAQSLAWTVEGARYLDGISGERLWAEFELLADHPRAARAVELLGAWGVLRATHAAWRLAPESRAAVGRLRRAPGSEVFSGLLLAPLQRRRAILDRLRAPATARAAVEGTRRLLRARDASAKTLTTLEGASGAAREAARRLGGAHQRSVQRELRRWERTRPHLDAATLMRLGVTEGPAVGAWLRRLRRARYDGTLEEAAAARRLVRYELEERS